MRTLKSIAALLLVLALLWAVEQVASEPCLPNGYCYRTGD